MTSPTYQRQNFPDRIVLEPSTPADSCIIWLHGLGASGDDFVPVRRICYRLSIPLSHPCCAPFIRMHHSSR